MVCFVIRGLLCAGMSVVAILSATVFAQRAFCARLIRLRADADTARLGFV
jgi:hypothetical protein